MGCLYVGMNIHIKFSSCFSLWLFTPLIPLSFNATRLATVTTAHIHGQFLIGFQKRLEKFFSKYIIFYSSWAECFPPGHASHHCGKTFLSSCIVHTRQPSREGPLLFALPRCCQFLRNGCRTRR